MADTDVHWYVEATKPFDRSQAGEIRLTRHKDRASVLPLEVNLRVGDGCGNLPLEVIDGSSSEKQQRSAFGEVLDRVRRQLRDVAPGKLSGRQLQAMVRGKDEAIVEAARILATEAWEQFRQEPGSRNSVLYWYDPEAGVKGLSTREGAD